MADPFILTIAGTRYAGWQTLRVSRGIAQLAGSFQLSVSERFDGLDAARPIRPGQQAAIALAGETIITGYVDQVAPEYDAESHTLNISGRDATGDLVDCAAIHKSGNWSKQTLAQIASDLLKPFGVALDVQTDVGAPFDTVTIEPGETVFDLLERYARYRGVLLYSNGLGALVIGQPGTASAPANLVLGENILSASGTSSELERFADYIVKAQQMGSDTVSGAAAAAPSGEALDAAVGRYRPTVICAEDQADAASCKLRAEWQRTVAAARAQQTVYTVSGWRANGKLWQPNAIVHVTDQFMGLDADRLISQVDFTIDEQGSRTELTCVGVHAYDPIKLPEPATSEGLW